MFKGITALAGLVAIIALALGLLLGQPEILNPDNAKARADRMNAETSALRTQNYYEQQRQQQELEYQQKLKDLDLQHRARMAQMWEEILPIAVQVALAGFLMLAFGGGLFLAGRGVKQLPTGSARVALTRQPAANVLRFPGTANTGSPIEPGTRLQKTL